MKKAILIIICTVFFITGKAQTDSVATYTNYCKIGFIKKDSLINSMPEKKKIETVIQKALNIFEKEYNQMQNEYNKKVKTYLEKNGDMTETIKLVRQAEITEAEKRIALYKKRYTQQLKEEQDSLMQPLLNQIQKAISTVANEQKLTIVLDNATPLFLSSDCIDIYSLVEEKLKKQ